MRGGAVTPSRAADTPAPKRKRPASDPKVLRLIPAEFASRHLVLPLRRTGRTLSVAMADPSDAALIDDLQFLTQFEIDAVGVGEHTLRQRIDRSYEAATTRGGGRAEDVTVAPPADADSAEASEEPAVRLIDDLLADAVRRGASDIHFEPYESELRVRYRLDGRLREILRPPFQLAAALTSRLKILADLNIAERRIPQDGRIRMPVADRVIDFRVSTLPTLFGEKVVLRILDRERQAFDLESFGMETRAERELLAAIAQTSGMVLVTGPTGSGKTTTLYSALARLNTPEANIMTAEDPVEYSIEGINQVQIRPKIGLTFATTLRAFLRQDPNILMVGEIRDRETGGIAVKAALTGHLVLSTLHTNDAASTATRLVDMGIEAFNVAVAVKVITAQRLVPRICPDCRVEASYAPEILRSVGLQAGGRGQDAFYRGAGCDSCDGSGYSGRQGLYEVLPMSPAIRRLVLAGASSEEIERRAAKEGMITLRQDGFAKARRGIATLEDVLRETPA
ncbi:MAG: ATPase, T2SS/T4P/T4SS family [Gemmatimonadota bacterium]|uniref:GspE/PulE family protein n=1 Tax=Candidatus Palauibacter scopulicola TaxID=3056741 RepID=UPI0023837BD1|nr:ATPase, T2SS/T4P/T4SS family [Candidatus Palauibacter scopulicola]MDE2663185.1 ATPase, T2SS/T4P/T4SS family [Candidatus Palauibacter scopulicola]